MREIKFRGYALEKMVKSQWLEGFGISELQFAEHYAKEIGRSSDWWLYTESGDYLVDPESIGQYTGLKDKNGKEIYEGDIAQGANGKKYVFRWGISSNGFIAQTDETHCNVYSSYHIAPKLEVIGNIHENPELLEEDE
ncbi:MAG: YopX family protein [Bacillota bacterium]